MGSYLLPKGIHDKMNLVRAKFLCQGASEDFKCHMAKWSTVDRPKAQGGLGVIK
jgi:hypothetical protein